MPTARGPPAWTLRVLDDLARDRGAVALRVNPSFAVQGSGLIKGGWPRQMGVQASMGTRILDEEPIVENTPRRGSSWTRPAGAIMPFEYSREQ